MQYNVTHWGVILVIFFVLFGVSTWLLATGDANYIQGLYWPGTVGLATTGVTQTTVQCFLIYHYWRMSVILFHLLKGLLFKAHSDLRSQNNYVTTVLILSMVAAVCPSSSWFRMCANTNFEVRG